MNIIEYLLLKPIYALIFNLIVVGGRIINILGLSQARVTTIRVGTIRMIGPKVGIEVMQRAINRLEEEDLELYQRLTCGPKCSIMSGSDRNSFSFRYGYIILSVSYFYSIEGLVSLFVFLGLLGEGKDIWKNSDKNALSEKVKKACKQTVSWLELKEYPGPVIQWMREDGLERNINPPRSLRRTKERRM